MGLVVHEHNISSGQNFTGAAPSGNPSVAPGVLKKWAAGNAGGLFVFDSDEALELYFVQAKLANQSSWTLQLIDSDGTTVVATIASGTNETSYFYSSTARHVLLPGQRLKLTTTGASSGAMVARVGLKRIER